MNLSNLDRSIRLFSGASILTFDYLASSSWEIVFLILGLWGLVSSVFGYCPFYSLMGFNTCPNNINLRQFSTSVENTQSD